MCNAIRRYAHHGIAAIVFASIFSASIDDEGSGCTPCECECETAWHDGSARYDFVMDEQTLAIKPLTLTQRRQGRKRWPGPMHPGRSEKGHFRQPVVLAGPLPESPAPGRNRAAGKGVPSRLHHARAAPAAGCLVRFPDREASIVAEAGLSSA